MKLASYNDGSRDGHLVVVSRDLSQAHYASGIATRMQQVLDDWRFVAPQLEELSHSLNHGRARHAFPFEPAKCMAPLPRSHHWVLAQAWRSPQELASPAVGPHLLRGAGDVLLGPCTSPTFTPCAFSNPTSSASSASAASRAAAPPLGLDVEAQWLLLAGDVPRAATPPEALEQLRLVGLALTWWQRDVQATEQARSQSPLHAWPASNFSPVFATPDELGEAWRGGRLRLPLSLHVNNLLVGRCDGGHEMGWHAGQLLAWLARHQRLGAGTLLGCGPVRLSDASLPSPDAKPAKAKPSKAQMQAQARIGACSLADLRALQQAAQVPLSPWLQPGDSVSVDLHGPDGQSVFGAMDVTLAGSAEAGEPGEADEAAQAQAGAANPEERA